MTGWHWSGKRHHSAVLTGNINGIPQSLGACAVHYCNDIGFTYTARIGVLNSRRMNILLLRSSNGFDDPPETTCEELSNEQRRAEQGRRRTLVHGILGQECQFRGDR